MMWNVMNTLIPSLSIRLSQPDQKCSVWRKSECTEMSKTKIIWLQWVSVLYYPDPTVKMKAELMPVFWFSSFCRHLVSGVAAGVWSPSGCVNVTNGSFTMGRETAGRRDGDSATSSSHLASWGQQGRFIRVGNVSKWVQNIGDIGH